jgi:hypothetical protein
LTGFNHNLKNNSPDSDPRYSKIPIKRDLLETNIILWYYYTVILLISTFLLSSDL